MREESAVGQRERERDPGGFSRVEGVGLSRAGRRALLLRVGLRHAHRVRQELVVSFLALLIHMYNYWRCVLLRVGLIHAHSDAVGVIHAHFEGNLNRLRREFFKFPSKSI